MTVDRPRQAARVDHPGARRQRVPAADGLVLFFKNLLYLNGFATALAPDTDLFTQIEPVFVWFQARHGLALAQVIVTD